MTVRTDEVKNFGVHTGAYAELTVAIRERICKVIMDELNARITGGSTNIDVRAVIEEERSDIVFLTIVTFNKDVQLREAVKQ